MEKSYYEAKGSSELRLFGRVVFSCVVVGGRRRSSKDKGASLRVTAGYKPQQDDSEINSKKIDKTTPFRSIQGRWWYPTRGGSALRAHQRSDYDTVAEGGNPASYLRRERAARAPEF